MLLHVEAELDHLGVLDAVFLASGAEFAGFAGFGLGGDVDGVLEGDGFGGDETALEVGADCIGLPPTAPSALAPTSILS